MEVEKVLALKVKATFYCCDGNLQGFTHICLDQPILFSQKALGKSHLEWFPFRSHMCNIFEFFFSEIRPVIPLKIHLDISLKIPPGILCKFLGRVPWEFLYYLLIKAIKETFRNSIRYISKKSQKVLFRKSCRIVSKIPLCIWSEPLEEFLQSHSRVNSKIPPLISSDSFGKSYIKS